MDIHTDGYELQRLLARLAERQPDEDGLVRLTSDERDDLVVLARECLDLAWCLDSALSAY